MDTATVSVIASSTVAVAAIGATWLQHRASLKHERTVVDLDNVRDVLDEAAVALHQMAYVFDDLRSRLTQHRPTPDESEAARRQVKRIEREQVEEVGLNRERFDQAST